MADFTLESISASGVITATDAGGRRHLFHTDPAEARAFERLTGWLSAGVEELGLLLHAGSTPAWLNRRQADGRSDDELKTAWLRKVTNAGMPEASALQFFEARISLGA